MNWTIYFVGIPILESVWVLFILLWSPWKVSKPLAGLVFLANLVWPIGLPLVLILCAVSWMVNHDDEYVLSRKLKKRELAEQMKRRMTNGGGA